jgi:Flagellar biosynthesis pathway, component FlhB
MSDEPDQDSKTEEATPKKTQDAIEKGNIASSRELPMLFSLGAMLIVMVWVIGNGAARLAVTLRGFLDNPGDVRLEQGQDAVLLLDAVGLEMGTFLVPTIVIFAVAGLAGSFVQNVPQVVFDRIKPELSRLSIAKGWKRSSACRASSSSARRSSSSAPRPSWFDHPQNRTASDGERHVLRPRRSGRLHGRHRHPPALRRLHRHGASGGRRSDLGAHPVAAQPAHDQAGGEGRVQEHRGRSAGQGADALAGRDRIRHRMMANVPRATLVLANPTHYAIALRYVYEEGGAPVVLAKGQDLVALKIREIAEENGIPVVEDKLLTRAMYGKVELDQMIPVEFYRAVAEVIYLLQTRSSDSHLPAIVHGHS